MLQSYDHNLEGEKVLLKQEVFQRKILSTFTCNLKGVTFRLDARLCGGQQLQFNAILESGSASRNPVTKSTKMANQFSSIKRDLIPLTLAETFWAYKKEVHTPFHHRKSSPYSVPAIRSAKIG